jgi:hypothetical protein
MLPKGGFRDRVMSWKYRFNFYNFKNINQRLPLTTFCVKAPGQGTGMLWLWYMAAFLANSHFGGAASLAAVLGPFEGLGTASLAKMSPAFGKGNNGFSLCPGPKNRPLAFMGVHRSIVMPGKGLRV